MNKICLLIILVTTVMLKFSSTAQAESKLYNEFNGGCLDVSENTPGGKVVIDHCEATRQFQIWDFIDGRFHNKQSGMCLDVGENTPGGKVVIDYCEYGKPHILTRPFQLWHWRLLLPTLDLKANGLDSLSMYFSTDNPNLSVEVKKPVSNESSDMFYDFTYAMQDPEGRIFSYIYDTGQWKEGPHISVTSKINSDVKVNLPLRKLETPGMYAFYISADSDDGKIAALQPPEEKLDYRGDYVKVFKPQNISAGFFNIAHMANTPRAVDYAVTAGANAVEVDLRFDSNGQPDRFRHGWPCDCFCNTVHVIATGGITQTPPICSALYDDCFAGTPAVELLKHIASKKELALVVIDSKVSTSDNLETCGRNLIETLNNHLFSNGYQGNVIIGVAKSETLPYLEAAACQATALSNPYQYYFSIDQEGSETARTIRDLIKLNRCSNNRVYGTGISACVAGNYEDAINLGKLNQEKGTVGTVYIWTIDKKSSMEKYLEKGALGIMTNDPALLDSVIKSKGISLAAPSSSIPFASSVDVVESLP